MRNDFPRYRTLLLALLLFLASLHLITVSLHRAERRNERFTSLDKAILTFYQPIYRVLSWPFVKVSDAWVAYVDILSTGRDNRILLERNRQMAAGLAQLGRLERENKTLREMMDYMEEGHPILSPASVIARSQGEKAGVVMVDRGSDNSVETGMTVVTPGGLVGYVAATAGSVSKVRFITDPLSAVDAVTSRTGARGILRGLGNGSCRLIYIKWAEDVQPGDDVVTSGQGLFPAGLLVGKVASIVPGGFDFAKAVEVAPSVDFDHLMNVFVLKRTDADREKESMARQEPVPKEKKKR